jgi:hypothetical protein
MVLLDESRLPSSIVVKLEQYLWKVRMTTYIKNQDFPFPNKYNNAMLDLIRVNHPDTGAIHFLNSWMPHKPVFFAVTEKAYLESNFRVAFTMGGKLKDYMNFQYFPLESISLIECNEDGAILLTIDPKIDGIHLLGADLDQKKIRQVTSVLAEDFADLCKYIHASQKALGVKLAKVVEGEAEDDSEPEPSANIDDLSESLLKAKKLLDSGAISQKEFNDIKKSILGS